MHKVDGVGAVAVKPDKPEPGTEGWFSEGDPLVPSPPTQVTYQWLNTMQSELIALAEADGGVLDRDNDAQLAGIYGSLPAKARMLRHDLGRAGQFGIGNGTPVLRFPGDMDAVQVWAEDYTITPGVSPIVHTLTWDDAPNGSWVAAGDYDEPVRIRFSGYQAGKAVSIVEANVTGTYIVFVETYTVDATPGAEVTGWRLNIDLIAGYLANHLLKPWILSFDYDSGTGAISNETVPDLGRMWAPIWQSLPHRMLRNSNGDVAATDVVDNTRPEVRERVFPDGVAVDPGDLTRVWTKRWMPDAATRRYELTGIGGEEDGAGSGNLLPGYKLEVGLGGADDLLIRAIDTKITGMKRGTGTTKFEYYKTGGGQDSNDADGQKPYFKLPDIKLIGTKTYEVEVPLGDAKDISSGNWLMDEFVTGYLSTDMTTDAVWLTPPWRVGQTFVGFKVRAFLSSPTVGDTVTGKILKLDATTTIGTTADQTLVGAVTSVDWVHGETTPTQKDLLLATPATLVAGQKYLLQLSTSITAGTVAVVSEVLAVYRFTEI